MVEGVEMDTRDVMVKREEEGGGERESATRRHTTPIDNTSEHEAQAAYNPINRINEEEEQVVQ